MGKKNYVVMDGNTAAAYSAYAFTEVAAIYPITPSSPMAEKVDEWSAKGKKNLFGSTVDVIQMQSEAGAAGTCHGSLQAGALTTTFTSSQGLMLMIPAMYAMGGQFLPSVMHIASRVVTSNHHSIFGDHTDFMTCRTTGYAMLMSSCPQEAMDLAAVAHLSAISGRYAFMHCFDGFRTSHEMQRIEALDYEDLRGLVDQESLQAFRRASLNPEHPTNRGNNVNPDVYFQCKEGANVKANALPDTVQHYMDEINKLTGRDYKLFNYYGAPDAEEVIVVMCSASETVKETVDYLNAQGRKVGMVQIHLFRPFSVKHFAAAIPATCKRIAVLDRNKETGSVGEPVYLDVVTALNQAGRGDIRVVGGRYGLSSKDTTPGQIIAVYDNLKQAEPKNNFTIGINDDVTHTSLDYTEIELPHPGQISCKLWGLGGDGTVGANKNAISTIGFVGGKYAQAYFSYDTMKSGGLTQSHLRFGDEPIRSTYLVNSADFVACHAPTYVKKYDLTEDLKEGGTAITMFIPMMNGTKELQRHYFLKYNSIYFASKWNTAAARNDKITLRGFASPTGEIAAITITPYSDLYVSILFGSILKQQRCKRGEPVTLSMSKDTALNDTELYIYSASMLEAVEGIASVYTNQADFSAATKLRSIVIGSDADGYSNVNLTSSIKLDFSALAVLEELRIDHCPNLTAPVDVSGCVALKVASFKGTPVSAVNFAAGSALETCYLERPVSLTLRNMQNIKTFEVADGYANLTGLRHENTPFPAALDIVNAAAKLYTVRLVGIDWQLTGTDLMNRLLGMGGYDENGLEVQQSSLSGKVYTSVIRQAEVEKYTAAWPDLALTYGGTVQQKSEAKRS